MEYNKTEEKLILGQSSLKLCFSLQQLTQTGAPHLLHTFRFYRQEWGKKTPKPGNLSFVWKKFVHKDTTY